MSNTHNQAPGYQIAEQLFVNMLSAATANESLDAMHMALTELRKLPHQKQTAIGFVRALTAFAVNDQPLSDSAVCNGPSNIDPAGDLDDLPF